MKVTIEITRTFTFTADVAGQTDAEDIVRWLIQVADTGVKAQLPPGLHHEKTSTTGGVSEVDLRY